MSRSRCRRAGALLLLVLCAPALSVAYAAQVARDAELAEADHLTSRIDELKRDWRYADAEDLAARQLETRRRFLGDEHRDVADSLERLASILHSEGKFAEAEKRCREALEMRRKLTGENDPAVAQSLDQLGNLRVAQGDLVGAETLILKSLALRRALLGEENIEVARSLDSVAWFRAEQGNWEDAESWMRECLALSRKILGDEDVDVARRMNALAYFVRVQEKYAEAESLLSQALAIRRKIFGSEHPEVAQTLHSLACFQRDRPEHDYASAEEYFRRSLAMFRKSCPEDHPSVILNLANLGDLLRAEGKDGEAEPMIREALALRRRVFGEEHDYVRQSLWALQELLFFNRHDYAGAETVLHEMARIYEAELRTSASPDQPATYSGAPYRRLAEVQLLLGKTDEAWRTLERHSGRALSDLLFDAGNRNLSAAEAASKKILENRRDSLEHEVSALRKAPIGPDTSGTRLEETRTRLLAAQADLQAFEGVIAAKRPRRADTVFSLKRVQASIPEGTAILGSLDNLGSAWAYVMRRTGPVHWVRLDLKDDVANDPGTAHSRRFRELLGGDATSGLGVQMTPEVSQRARDFYGGRIAPMMPFLQGIENLIVIPSNYTWLYPVEALVDAEGNWLVDRYAVSYAHSASLYALFAGRERRHGRSRPALVLGDPPFREAHLAAMTREASEERGGMPEDAREDPLDAATVLRALDGDRTALASLPRLRWSREEVRSVASLLPYATLLVGPDASEQSLLRLEAEGALGKFETIHFSTHALADPNGPERSALILSQVSPSNGERAEGPAADGLLTAKEVAREWRLDADLVTLSACETGYGLNVYGEGFTGMSYAFLQAGARSVLASLWEVNDRATSLLMRRFYENHLGAYHGVRQGRAGTPMSKAQALQEAKIWLRGYTDDRGRHPYEHPHYWAGFELIGDPR